MKHLAIRARPAGESPRARRARTEPPRAPPHPRTGVSGSRRDGTSISLRPLSRRDCVPKPGVAREPSYPGDGRRHHLPRRGCGRAVPGVPERRVSRQPLALQRLRSLRDARVASTLRSRETANTSCRSGSRLAAVKHRVTYYQSSSLTDPRRTLTKRRLPGKDEQGRGVIPASPHSNYYIHSIHALPRPASLSLPRVPCPPWFLRLFLPDFASIRGPKSRLPPSPRRGFHPSPAFYRLQTPSIPSLSSCSIRLSRPPAVPCGEFSPVEPPSFRDPGKNRRKSSRKVLTRGPIRVGSSPPQRTTRRERRRSIATPKESDRLFSPLERRSFTSMARQTRRNLLRRH